MGCLSECSPLFWLNYSCSRVWMGFHEPKEQIYLHLLSYSKYNSHFCIRATGSSSIFSHVWCHWPLQGHVFPNAIRVSAAHIVERLSTAQTLQPPSPAQFPLRIDLPGSPWPHHSPSACNEFSKTSNSRNCHLSRTSAWSGPQSRQSVCLLLRACPAHSPRLSSPGFVVSRLHCAG